MPGRSLSAPAPHLSTRRTMAKLKQHTNERRCPLLTSAGARHRPAKAQNRRSPQNAMSKCSATLSRLLFGRLAGVLPAHNALGVVLHFGVAKLHGGLRALLIGGPALIGSVRDDQSAPVRRQLAGHRVLYLREVDGSWDAPLDIRLGAVDA